ncbi:MarR family winged helix-turn-helix transcriptional regulator [Oryzibacter oryziterrae]|uniref:MarR family winged helix-turn-helix transcriptional regulator n=1 Tax=Oryzibacter oryziterrae TaxID=2766474 RepID=UPI001F028ACC|nr:MarR family transcriptional regulator [Oryzibacter oryziterrae]
MEAGDEETEIHGATGDDIDIGPLGQEIGYVLRRAQLMIFRRFFADFAAEDIKPAQYSTLMIVSRNPGVAQGRVAAALDIKKTNFVAMVSELERRGLMLRRPSATDRRSQCLHLTDTGVALVERLRSIAARNEDRIAAALGDGVYDGLFAPLRRIARGEF